MRIWTFWCCCIWFTTCSATLTDKQEIVIIKQVSTQTKSYQKKPGLIPSSTGVPLELLDWWAPMAWKSKSTGLKPRRGVLEQKMAAEHIHVITQTNTCKQDKQGICCLHDRRPSLIGEPPGFCWHYLGRSALPCIGTCKNIPLLYDFMTDIWPKDWSATCTSWQKTLRPSLTKHTAHPPE